MSLTLYLVRHAQPEGGAVLRGRRDDGLSGLGVLQAIRLGQRLPHLEPALDAAYASPLRRARKTAEIALIGMRKRLALLDGLMEVDWGDLTGTPLAEAERQHDPTIEAWRRGEEFAPPGGETRRELDHRVRSALGRIVAQGPATALVVTHGGPIQVMLRTLLGPDHPGRPEWSVPEASLSAVAIGDDGARLLFLGDTSHLQGTEVISELPSSI